MSSSAFLKETSEDLKKVIEEITDATVLANMELGDHDWRTRPGMEVLKVQSKAKLVELHNDFNKKFFNTIVKIFAVGPNEKIEGIAKELHKDIFTLFIPSLYENIAELVKPKLGLSNEFGADAYLRLVDVLGTFSRAHNITPINNPQPVIGVAVNNNQELVDLVKKITRNAFGDVLNKSYILNTVSAKALEVKMDKKYCVVVLGGMSTEERDVLAEALYSGKPTFTLEIGNEERTNKSFASSMYTKMFETLSTRYKAKKGKLTNLSSDVENSKTDVIEAEETLTESNNS